MEVKFRRSAEYVSQLIRLLLNWRNRQFNASWQMVLGPPIESSERKVARAAPRMRLLAARWPPPAAHCPLLLG